MNHVPNGYIPIVSALMPDKSPQCISVSTVRKRQCDMAEYESPQELRRWRLHLRLRTNRIAIDNIVGLCVFIDFERYGGPGEGIFPLKQYIP